jgi:hypothetical protein
MIEILGLMIRELQILRESYQLSYKLNDNIEGAIVYLDCAIQNLIDEEKEKENV